MPTKLTPGTCSFSKLKPVMLRNPVVDKFIVNVSAMEGKFYR
jgi:hypothetical protein